MDVCLPAVLQMRALCKDKMQFKHLASTEVCSIMIVQQKALKVKALKSLQGAEVFNEQFIQRCEFAEEEFYTTKTL